MADHPFTYQTCLFPDASQGFRIQIPARMRHGYLAGLAGMYELYMRADLRLDYPSVPA